MGEVIGAVSAIAALVQLTGLVASVAYRYVGSAKNAQSEAKKLWDEVKSLEAVLQKLQASSVPTSQIWLLFNPRWPLPKKETTQAILQIERHKSLFNLALTADQHCLSHAIKVFSENTNTAVGNIMESLKKEFVDIRRARQEEELSRTGEKRRKILDGIYPNPTDRRHVEISGRRHKYTGKWFSRHPDFQAWVDNKLSIQMLWGHGIPGAGKTFIASLVIDELESSASAEKYGVAYIYFNFKEQEQQHPTQALSSLIKQLLTQIKEPTIPAEVEKLYEEFILEGKQPPLQYLQQVLYSLSGRFPRVFFVFDALDECDEKAQRKELLPFFHSLVQMGHSVFVTSRPYPRDIYECLKKARTTKIEISANEEDIKMFIVETIDENSHAKALIQGDLRERIILKLVDLCKGMFLLVHFHINDLCQYTTVREVDDALRLLHTITPAQNPLREMYDRIIRNIIQRQHPSRMKLAKRILSWLVAAKEVLKSQELRMAVAMGPDDQGPPSQGDMPDNSMILEVCGGLVMIDEITATVRLSHYSVQEYLLQSSFTSQPHLIIVDFFVTYLCFNYHEPDKIMEYRESSSQYYYYHYYSYQTDPQIHQNFPELYLSKYFHKHLKACDERSSTEIYLKLLKNKNALAYYQSLTRDLPDSDRVEHNRMDGHIFDNTETIIRFCRTYSHERMVSPLLEATLLGHLGSVKALLKDDGYCNQSVTDSGMTVLHHAALKGHNSIIEFFLELGNDINSPDKYGRTPLAMALVARHEDTAKLLLERSATTLSVVPGAVTPLHIAAFHGLRKICSLLVRAGADVNAEGLGGITPLHLANTRSSPHLEVVKLLLDHGALKYIFQILMKLRERVRARLRSFKPLHSLIEEYWDKIPDAFQYELTQSSARKAARDLEIGKLSVRRANIENALAELRVEYCKDSGDKTGAIFQKKLEVGARMEIDKDFSYLSPSFHNAEERNSLLECLKSEGNRNRKPKALSDHLKVLEQAWFDKMIETDPIIPGFDYARPPWVEELEVANDTET